MQAFQRQIHERLTQLELINKQYRRLARENRTDSASRLKHMVHEGNQRWDSLQRRVAAVLRRLRVTFSPSPGAFLDVQGKVVRWYRACNKVRGRFHLRPSCLILPSSLPF